MNRLLLATLVLTLTPAALACPVKTGTVANGLFRDTRKLTPICGPLYLTFKNVMAGTKWTEMYALDSQASQTRTAQTNAILASIVKGGYRKVREQKKARSQVYLFQRGKSSITAVVGISGPVHYLALAGQ